MMDGNEKENTYGEETAWVSEERSDEGRKEGDRRIW